MKKNIVVKKNNALTDGYIPKTGKEVLPDKLLNALVYKYEKEGLSFTMELSEVRTLLGIKSKAIKDNERIYKAFEVLGTGMQLRDFTYKGREVKWATANFCNTKIYKDKQNYVEVRIDDTMIAYLKSKYGYTPIDINICNQFRTKFGLKLYEMHLRYESLPNHIDNVGFIKKSIDELNKIFSTKYKTQSEMKRSIDRGLKEIEKITGVEINCHYDKIEKVFVFCWEQKVRYLRSLKVFINYVRKNYATCYDQKLQKDIYPIVADTKQGLLKVDKNGHLYITKDKETEYLDAKQSQNIWEWLYEMVKDGKIVLSPNALT